MSIIKTVSKYEFANEFSRCGRGGQFSREGQEALFDYLEDFSNDTGEPLELDVISLCCDYSEDNVIDVLSDYNVSSIDELSGRTMVIHHNKVNNTVLYRNY